MVALQELNRSLSNPVKGVNSAEARRTLEKFVAQHAARAWSGTNTIWRPCDDPAQPDEPQDDLMPLTNVIVDHIAKCSPETLLHILVALRILLRKGSNRLGFPRAAIQAVVSLLHEPRSTQIMKECFRLVLHMCYEQRNVMAFVELGGVPLLLRLLRKLSDHDLQACLLGAIQSICYQAVGRVAVREGDGIQHVAASLRSNSEKVRARAVGALHNLSADPRAIAALRVSDAIPCLVSMLSSSNPDICSAAAGALQNVSRERLSRDLIEELDAVGPLADLLSSGDVHCQACAAGALYNVMVPSIHEKDDLRRFKETLSDVIALGAVRSCVYDDSSGAAES